MSSDIKCEKCYAVIKVSTAMWPVGWGSIAMLCCAAILARFDERLTLPLITSGIAVLLSGLIAYRRRAGLVEQVSPQLTRIRCIWAAGVAISLASAIIFAFSLDPSSPGTLVTIGAECVFLIAILVWVGAAAYAEWLERS